MASPLLDKVNWRRRWRGFGPLSELVRGCPGEGRFTGVVEVASEHPNRFFVDFKPPIQQRRGGIVGAFVDKRSNRADVLHNSAIVVGKLLDHLNSARNRGFFFDFPQFGEV